MQGIYTVSERTNKKYTVFQAIEAARVRLKARHYGSAVCTDSIRGINELTPITLERLNELSDIMVSDTINLERPSRGQH